jgi:hypothetical protein
MVNNNGVVELLDRLARAKEQIDNLHADIIKRSSIPSDAYVAIVIAQHHLERAQDLLRTKKVT